MNTLKLNDKKKSELLRYYGIVRNIAIVSACFSIIVMVIMTTNSLQFLKNQPINSPELLTLIKQSQNDKDNVELVKTIRAYDLLARKAHFTALAFGNFGSYLLAGGLLVFLIALKLMYELKRKVPDPGTFRIIEDDPRSRWLIQYSILGAAVLIIATSFVVPRMLTSKRTETSPMLTAEPASAEEAKSNWVSFRGFNGLGIAYNADPVTDWNGPEGRNILWKTQIPKSGVNSPIYWQGKIFLSGADKESREVYCLDMDTGSIIWSRKTSAGENITLPDVMEDTGIAAATMATDGRFVASIFATGEIIALDIDGNIIWEKNLGVPDNSYGHSSSLITYKGLVFVQYDQADSARVIAFDMSRGTKVWEQVREVETSWSSPVIINSSHGDQLILTADPYITAYEPETGRQLWQIKDIITGEIGSSCAFFNDRLYAANQFALLACIDIKSKEILWQHEDNLPDAASPVAYGEYLILPSSYEKVSCFDATTGSMYWDHRFENAFYSSPVIVNDKVYIVDKKGVTRIFALAEKFTNISAPELGEDCVATPAFVGERILIRGKENLYCIGKKK